ncbi:MAG: ABC transporter permease [Clostridiales bacterium]|nr:ABC transporter permease [Clostridiales bacterium]
MSKNVKENAAVIDTSAPKRENQILATAKIVLKNPGSVAGIIMIALIIIACVVVPLVSPYTYSQIDPSHALQAPSLAHPFGTDQYGRDVLVRVTYGARYTLSIGVFSTLISVVLGVLVGAIAGFFGGWIDNLFMRVLDVIQAFPQLLMAITLSAVFGTGFDKTIIAIGITGFPAVARMLRANILTVRRQEYIEAAVTINCNTPRIIMQHALPNAVSPLIVQIAMDIARAGMTAAALSFIGLGVQEPTPEWGALLSAGRSFIRDYSYLCLFPGLAIMLTTLSFNLIGDGLRDALDPKLRR